MEIRATGFSRHHSQLPEVKCLLRASQLTVDGGRHHSVRIPLGLVCHDTFRRDSAKVKPWKEGQQVLRVLADAREFIPIHHGQRCTGTPKARRAACYLVAQPSQTGFSFDPPCALRPACRTVRAGHRWLADGFSPEAKTHPGASPASRAGSSCSHPFKILAVERAVHLLQTNSASVDQIAAQAGYVDGVTLRTLIRRKIGQRVRELQACN